MGFSESERNSLHVMILSVSCLSITACLAVIFLYVWLKELRHFTFKLVVYLVATDIAKGCALLLPTEDRACCIAQGFLSVYFKLSSILWVAVISYVMHSVIVKRNMNIQDKEITFLLICNLIPLVAASLPLIFDKYGYAQGWCSIEETGHNFALEFTLRWLVFYLPLYLVFGYSFYTYHRVHKEVTRFSSHSSRSDKFSEAQSFMYKLYLYPFMLVVSYTPSTIYRIYNLITMGDSLFALAFMSAFSMSLNGLLNALVYGLNKYVRQALQDKWKGGQNVIGSFVSLDTIDEDREDP